MALLVSDEFHVITSLEARHPFASFLVEPIPEKRDDSVAVAYRDS
jgi:hypothetical protein